MSSSVSGSTYSTSDLPARLERRLVGAAGVPELAVDEDETSAADGCGLADEPVRSDRHRHAPHLRRLRQRQAEEQRERAGDRDRDGHRDLVGVAGRIEEHQRSDHEHDRARERQRTVRDDERLGDEEAGREQHQQESRRRDRQHLEAVEADDQRDRSDRAREDEAGVPELDDDPDQSDREHQRDDVRVDQEIEQALPGRKPDAVDLRLRRGRDRQPLGLGLHPVDLAEEVRIVDREDVGNVLLHRFARAQVRRLRDHVSRRLDVAAVLPRELADVGGGVVDDLSA